MAPDSPGPLGSTTPRRWASLSLGFLCATMAACASSGPRPAQSGTAPDLPTGTSWEAGFANQPSAVRDTVLLEPRSQVWAALPGVFEELGVPASTRDQRAFVIGNGGWRPTAIHGTRLSAFLRCGAGLTGPNADTYDVTALLFVQLEAPSSTETLVRIVLDANARPRSSSGTAVRCTSVGTLEARVLRLIGDRLVRMAGSEGGALAPLPLEDAPGLTASRLPRVGDVLRIECGAPGEEARVGQGDFVAAATGTVTLRLGPTRPGVAFPAAHVRSVQIRERNSRASLGAVVGGIIGLVAGAYVGHGAYDPEATTHYRQSTITAIGAVVGTVSGALLGATAGWFVRDEEWIDVPPAWWEREGPSSTAQAPRSLPAATPSCPLVD